MSGSLGADTDTAGGLGRPASGSRPPSSPTAHLSSLGFPSLSTTFHCLLCVFCWSPSPVPLHAAPSPSLPSAPRPARRPSPPRRRVHPPPTRLLTAGNCWLRQAKNGRCQVLYKTELSKEECCSTGRLSTSWTEEDVNDNTLFKWMIFNGGAPNCIPCKGGTLPSRVTGRPAVEGVLPSVSPLPALCLAPPHFPQPREALGWSLACYTLYAKQGRQRFP